MGNLCYLAIVYAVTIKILTDSNLINVYIVLSTLFSFASYYTVTYLQSQFPYFSDVYGQFWEFNSRHLLFFCIFLSKFVMVPFNKLVNALNTEFEENETQVKNQSKLLRDSEF